MTESEFQGTPEQRAIMSLLDVVEELAGGLASGLKPDMDWYEVVYETFAKHRLEIRLGEVQG